MLERHPVSKKFAVDHLRDFAKAMMDFAPKSARLPFRHDRFGPQRLPFAALIDARFCWPKAEKLWSPTELASRIGCHVSTIYRGIEEGVVPAKRRTRSRWAIGRTAWERAFPLTLVSH